MSVHDKCYQRRMADDGGQYILLPRDAAFLTTPALSVQKTLVAPAIPSAPKTESSPEVEAMVNEFFASLDSKRNSDL